MKQMVGSSTMSYDMANDLVGATLSLPAGHAAGNWCARSRGNGGHLDLARSGWHWLQVTASRGFPPSSTACANGSSFTFAV